MMRDAQLLHEEYFLLFSKDCGKVAGRSGLSILTSLLIMPSRLVQLHTGLCLDFGNGLSSRLLILVPQGRQERTGSGEEDAVVRLAFDQTNH